MWLEIAALLLTALFLWDHLRTRRANKLFAAAGINGPTSYPLLGSAPVMMLGESAKSMLAKDANIISTNQISFCSHVGTGATFDR